MLFRSQGGGAAVRALLFGDRLRLEPEFMDRIRRAGLAHSLALSGLHLGIAAAFGFGAAWVLGAMCPPVLLRIPRQKLGLVLALPVAAPDSLLRVAMDIKPVRRPVVLPAQKLDSFERKGFAVVEWGGRVVGEDRIK